MPRLESIRKATPEFGPSGEKEVENRALLADKSGMLIHRVPAVPTDAG